LVLVDHVNKFFIKEVYVIMTRAMGSSKKSFFDLGWRPRLGGKFDRGTVVLVVTEDALGWMGKIEDGEVAAFSPELYEVMPTQFFNQQGITSHVRT
jgi:hypothetical protein